MGRYQARKKAAAILENQDLPDLKCADVANAAVKIQKVYRGFQGRQKVKVLKDPEMAKAAVKIQSVYRGFQTRQEKAKKLNDNNGDDELPDLKDPEMAKAAVKIQSVFRGFQTRQEKELHHPSLKVDERDRKRGPIRKKVVLESTLEEKGELLRHPGDVVAAAITLQRFFRKLQKNNQL